MLGDIRHDVYSPNGVLRRGLMALPVTDSCCLFLIAYFPDGFPGGFPDCCVTSSTTSPLVFNCCGRGGLHEAPLQSYFVLFQVLAKDDS